MRSTATVPATPYRFAPRNIYDDDPADPPNNVVMQPILVIGTRKSIVNPAARTSGLQPDSC